MLTSVVGTGATTFPEANPKNAPILEDVPAEEPAEAEPAEEEEIEEAPQEEEEAIEEEVEEPQEE